MRTTQQHYTAHKFNTQTPKLCMFCSPEPTTHTHTPTRIRARHTHARHSGLTWYSSLAHLRQRLCWQGRMTTGLVKISRQMGHSSCFSSVPRAASLSAPWKPRRELRSTGRAMLRPAWCRHTQPHTRTHTHPSLATSASGPL